MTHATHTADSLTPMHSCTCSAGEGEVTVRYVTYSKDKAVVERYLDPTQIRYFSFKDSWETSLSRKAQINLATGESNLKGIPQLLGERELQQGTASPPCATAEGALCAAWSMREFWRHVTATEAKIAPAVPADAPALQLPASTSRSTTSCLRRSSTISQTSLLQTSLPSREFPCLGIHNAVHADRRIWAGGLDVALTL